MSESLDYSRVTLYTHPKEMSTMSINEVDRVSVLYRQIAGVHCDYGDAREYAGIANNGTDSEMLDIPTHMARGLARALNVMREGQDMNCHRFSRFLHPDHAKGAENTHDKSFHPVSCDHRNNSPTVKLGMGAIGVIYSLEYGPLHSIVGLGEDNPNGLQVTSFKGVPVIAPHTDVLEYYQQVYADSYYVKLLRAT